MSTRCNVILRESYEDHEGKKQSEELIFYRHSDGYPEGALPSLSIFMKWLKKGKIRDNISQAAGWLILIGAMEYNTIPKYKAADGYGKIDSIESPKDWKCGSYEPTTSIHGDIDYLYEIDLTKKTITVKSVIDVDSKEFETIDPSEYKSYLL